jgi:hypothetical protein
MVRMVLELGKQPPNVEEVPVVQKQIDIQHGGQLEESFICDVNRMGTVCLPINPPINQPLTTLQVPALTHPTLLRTPITESVEITQLIYQKFYPQLFPREHQADIEKFLHEMHDLSFGTLSFRRWPERGAQILNGAKSKLQDPSISNRHREALEYKLTQ